jgi:hypothetical protein
MVRVGLAGSRRRPGGLDFSLRLCRAVAARPAFHGCFGLHEWAMVYGQAEQRRHAAWPLRLGAEGTDAVVRAMPVRCTHYDAFRFFTPGARPLNKLAPTLEARVENEQPGCVHVTMDLFKWAMKAQPWVSAELAADAFELAHVARSVDMRASPYDFSAIGLQAHRDRDNGRSRANTRPEQRRLVGAWPSPCGRGSSPNSSARSPDAWAQKRRTVRSAFRWSGATAQRRSTTRSL